VKNAIDLYRKHRVNPEVVKEIFEETYRKAME